MDELTTEPRRATAREISDAAVAVVRDTTGRGPVSCRVIIDRDAVVVLMRDALTRMEQTLVENGRSEEVLAARRALQEALRPELTAIVERATGRPVQAFMSANHTDPDCSVEVFVLDGPAL